MTAATPARGCDAFPRMLTALSSLAVRGDAPACAEKYEISLPVSKEIPYMCAPAPK